MTQPAMIACATDEQYAEMAAVMLRSLSLNGDVAGTAVYLVGDQLSETTVQDLRSCASGLDLRFIDLASSRDRISELPVSFYNAAIYIRLLLPDLIEQSGRVLYMDSDILIRRSIKELLATSLADKLAGAVVDGGLPHVHALANARLGRAEAALYFNSGVLLFDLDTWRDQKIGHRCIKTAQTRNDCWPDQDALNLVLDGCIKQLDPKWNFFSTQPLSRDAYEEAHILHFIPDKPTSANCRHPMFNDYIEIRNGTPWRDRSFATSISERRISELKRMVAERVRRQRSSAQDDK